MSHKLKFARTLNSLGSHAFLGGTDCHHFGITYGCQSDCPVFERGGCTDCHVENIEMFIERGDYDKEEVLKVIELYSDKITNEEKTKLSALANSL